MDGKIEKRLVCPYSKKCGGCNYQGTEYKEQLKIKQKSVEKLLSPFGTVEKIIGAKEPYFYRNKIHGIFGCDKKGNIYTGIYQEGTHRIVPIEKCLIEDERAAAILRDLCGLIKSFKLSVYDEDRECGLFRHALIRTGHVTGEIMLVLVITSPVMPSRNNFLKELKKLHPEISTVILNVNHKRTSMVLGEKNITAYGKGYIEDILCGLRFRISPSSFYQINPLQTEILYRTAIKAAGLTGKERVIDAYCGIGTIGMTAAKKAREVIGIELNKEAVRDAAANASLNQVKNIRFINEDAGKYMVKMAAGGERADVVLMDPPRSGSTKEFIDAVAVLKPQRVVYVSCNPETLARDLRIFAQKGYKAGLIQPVDMFPFTEHVETVVLLKRGGRE
ncbi:MAG: 23S rRNA (uracil(1939)-C(5))-methyltransferase RlmD [Thermoflexaceae bacterium]|nr:23S rRNA (uracil(1939)-C(5))-methyltransferase RlmD [Thermoflexaceae bacterium]